LKIKGFKVANIYSFGGFESFGSFGGTGLQRCQRLKIQGFKVSRFKGFKVANIYDLRRFTFQGFDVASRSDPPTWRMQMGTRACFINGVEPKSRSFDSRRARAKTGRGKPERGGRSG
jgi:hypothetical protein